MRHHLRPIGGAATPRTRSGRAGQTVGSIRWGCAVTPSETPSDDGPPPPSELSRMLSGVQRMLFDDRVVEALTVGAQLADADDPRTRVDARIYRLAALINLDRSGEYAAAVDAAFEAVRGYPEPGRYGRVHALAAVTAYRFGSLERCVNHLVRAAFALKAVELTDAMAAWGWHNLAMAYSYTGFHGYATGAIEQAREVAAAIGLPASDFVAPGIRLRLAVSLDHRGDADGCQRVLRDLVQDCQAKAASGELEKTRPINRANFGYAAVRLAAMGYKRALDGLDPVPLLRVGSSRRADDLRTLGRACLAISAGRPIEAVARLETAGVSDETAGAGEVPRLRALAHVATGDYASAYAADRQAFRVASADMERLRDLFMDGVAARLDRENLHERVAKYQDEANTDPLTGLPNRRYLEQYVADLVGHGGSAVLGVCDLDGFKKVNTVHGHLSGDIVLQRVAGVLNRVMRRGDFVARYGGDEFVVLLPSTSRAEANEIERRIVGAVTGEDWNALVPGTPISITIGWAAVGEGGLTRVIDAFESADMAMLHAKAAPRAS
jgi:diguanylate cyclase (GGDEF)-like protein